MVPVVVEARQEPESSHSYGFQHEACRDIFDLELGYSMENWSFAISEAGPVGFVIFGKD